MHIYLNQMSDFASLVREKAHDAGTYSLSQLITRLNELEVANRLSMDTSKGILTIHNILPNVYVPVLQDDSSYTELVNEILLTVSTITGTECKNLFEAKKALENVQTNSQWRKVNNAIIFYN